jgi:hypothetical protein
MSVQARDGATADELRDVAEAAMKAWPALTLARDKRPTAT